MPKRTFFKNEENPYDLSNEVVQPTTIAPAPAPSIPITRPIDEPSARVNVGTSGEVIIGADVNSAGITNGIVSSDVVLWAGSTRENRATAPFNVTLAGLLSATGATITGTLTATTGFIGGWAIATSDIKDIAGTTGLSSLVTGGDDIRLWAGDVTPGSAEFRVYESGALVASSATITGAITATSGSIGSFTIGTYLYTGTKTAYNDVNAGVHLGSDGIGIGNNVFTVDSAGALVATSATITGAITATSGSFTGAITATSGTIGGFTITATELYGGIIKTAATVEAGSTGVIMDTAGLRGYDSVLGQTFNLPTDGSAPYFSSGVINTTVFNIDTAGILRTSATVGDGTANSAGILINNTGIYGVAANQTPATANVRILVDGTAYFNASIRGGQTDYNTGTGYFLGLSGGDYKFSIGSAAGNYMTWDGTYLKLKGSFDVGSGGLINNSSYTVANLPIAPTSVGFNPPSAYE